MKKSLRIAFFAGRCLPITAATLEQRPLGGTETGVIRVAEQLRLRGHDVWVFTEAKEPPPSQPSYLNVREVLRAPEFDVFVSIKDWQPFFYPVRSRARFFWTGDSFDQYVNFGIGDPRVVAKIDALLAVSSWQAGALSEASGFPHDRCFVIGNGVHLPYFAGTEPRSRRRLIHTSAPYRGLELVPGLYGEVRRRVPDAELHVFSGLSIYDTDKPFAGPEQRQLARLAQVLREMPGCTVHQNIAQRELAREFMKSSVLFYPNTFVETSCIGVLEAQAAGCAIVTSARGALPETVADAGVCIPGDPGSKEYAESFVAAAVRMLTDDAAFEEARMRGYSRALESLGWERVAERFEAVVGAFL